MHIDRHKHYVVNRVQRGWCFSISLGHRRVILKRRKPQKGNYSRIFRSFSRIFLCFSSLLISWAARCFAGGDVPELIELKWENTTSLSLSSHLNCLEILAPSALSISNSMVTASTWVTISTISIFKLLLLFVFSIISPLPVTVPALASSLEISFKPESESFFLDFWVCLFSWYLRVF